MFLPKLFPFLLAFSTLHVAIASPFDSSAAWIAPLYVPPVEAHDLRNVTYIVVLKRDIQPSVFDTHLSFISLAEEVTLEQDEGSLETKIHHVYDSVILKGYSATLPRDVLELVRRRPEVQYVEQDQAGYGGDVQTNAPWVR